MIPSALSFAHAASTLALVGLIWTVQLVQYPLFAMVPADVFVSYHREHMRRITWVVGPLMLVELLSAGALVATAPVAVLPWIGLGLVAVVWVVTGFNSVPCHTILSRGFDAHVHRRLVSTNWLRTIAWTARGAVALLLL